ncbi:MAG: hypothetical protein HRT35_05835 [Algicola sp.]|nr:hypothetical protein [Algicola sp.]
MADYNKFNDAYDFKGMRHHFRTYATPAMIIIDKAGVVRVKRYHYFEQRALEQLLGEDIESLLNEYQHH